MHKGMDQSSNTIRDNWFHSKLQRIDILTCSMPKGIMHLQGGNSRIEMQWRWRNINVQQCFRSEFGSGSCQQLWASKHFCKYRPYLHNCLYYQPPCGGGVLIIWITVWSGNYCRKIPQKQNSITNGCITNCWSIDIFISKFALEISKFGHPSLCLHHDQILECLTLPTVGSPSSQESGSNFKIKGKSKWKTLEKLNCSKWIKFWIVYNK